MGKRTPRGATRAPVLMTFARLANACSRLSRHELDVTPENATLTCHKLQVSSAEARREFDYFATPMDRLLADTLEWMREQSLIGVPHGGLPR